MITFLDVMQRIRTILSSQTQKEKVLDKDIALALQVDPLYYAVMKKRNKIPYESIAYFAKKYHISLNWILLNQEPKYLDHISK